MWIPTDEEIAYYKLMGQSPDLSDDYVKSTLPALFEFAQGQCTTEFTVGQFPGGLNLFLANALKFYSQAQHGVKGERMGTVSFTYDFAALPSSITDFLLEFGYGRKKNYARFHAF